MQREIFNNDTFSMKKKIVQEKHVLTWTLYVPFSAWQIFMHQLLFRKLNPTVERAINIVNESLARYLLAFIFINSILPYSSFISRLVPQDPCKQT